MRPYNEIKFLWNWDDFEGIQTNLMNRAIVPSLDECLNELLHEEHHFLTQATMEQKKSVYVPVVYFPRLEGVTWVMSNVSVAKVLDILLPIVLFH
jgi:hypothetical protein